MHRSITLPILTLVLCVLPAAAQFAGRYTDGKDYAVYFVQTKYGLTIRPVMWTATQLLREIEKDKFVVVDRASRGAEFKRDAYGRVIGVTIRGMDGEGLELRRESGRQLPVELFLAGRVREAGAAYMTRGDKKKAVDDAEQVLRRLPTKSSIVVEFLKLLAPGFDSDAQFHTLLGYAFVQAGDRVSGLKSFRRAYELDRTNDRAVSGLARLGALPAKNPTGWKLPFPLASVFTPPTEKEIAAVEKDWERRDLRRRSVREELRSAVRVGDLEFIVRIVSHLVHGKRHYGAIILPDRAGEKSLPVIVEAKGVSPIYPPLDLTRLHSPRMMGDEAYRFAYVVPTFRGEVLNFDGKTFKSEGDRTDALDGATDDTIGLLTAALATTPEADPNRICAFGHSRGGNVALLTGIRDKRIDCVVNWAGPTDWFYAMGTNGWTEQELWAEGMRIRATTQQTGGQNIERFLMRAIDGDANLGQVRQRMIASSPLYFAHRLPPSQNHYGLEDPSVPSRNGLALCSRLTGRDIKLATTARSVCEKPERSHQIFFYPDQGHDTDRILAPIYSREFILRTIGMK